MATLLAVPVGAAAAATAALPLLPISGLTQVIADGADGYVFLDTGTSVVVTSLSGKQVATLEAGEAPVALATDDTHLFVASAGTDSIVESTEAQPGTVVKTYALPAGDKPSSLAYQAGKIWVSYSSGTLAGAYNVSGYTGQPIGTPVKENNAFTACAGTLEDMAVTANGGQVILSCSGNATQLGLSATSLAAVTVADYPGGATSDAIAVAPDNSGIATGTDNGTAPALSVFRAGASVPVLADPLAAAGEVVAPAGLAWTADAIRLAAVLKNTASGAYYLDVLEFPQYKASSLTVNPAGTDIFKAGTKVKLTGKLILGTAGAPAGIKLKIFRQVYGSTATVGTISATTAAGGGFTATDIPPKYGNYTYLAYYAGGTYAPAYHQCLVHVTIARAALSLTASARSVKAGRTVTVTAHLGNPHANRTVIIYAQPSGGARKVIKHANVSAKGVLSVSYKITGNTTFTVTFSGDSWYSPASASTTVKG